MLTMAVFFAGLEAYHYYSKLLNAVTTYPPDWFKWQQQDMTSITGVLEFQILSSAKLPRQSPIQRRGVVKIYPPQSGLVVNQPSRLLIVSAHY